MSKLMFPGDVARQKDWPRDETSACSNFSTNNPLTSIINLRRPATFAENLDGCLTGQLKFCDFARIESRLLSPRFFEPETDPFDMQITCALKRSNQPVAMSLDRLAQ